MSGSEILADLASDLSTEGEVTTGSWFGKPCLKVGSRVFAAYWRGAIAFKLAGEAHAEALQVPGAQLFDPRGAGQPMRQWVQIPAAQSATWGCYGRLACRFVAGQAQALKDELISGLIEARRRLLAAVLLLSVEQQDTVFLGTWSVKELLAHLVGWDQTNRRAVEEILAGRRPSFWQHHDRDWQSYNAMLVDQYMCDDLDELVTITQESHRSLVGFLREVPPDEYLRRQSIATLLHAEAKDEAEHTEQVLAFREAGRTLHHSTEVMGESDE